jgi:hypothetical protein
MGILDLFWIHPTDITEVVSGGSKGIDFLGELFAQSYDIHLKEFPADWETHNKAAGPIRNKQMAEYADALLLIWNGESKGSKNMKETMIKLGKPVYEIIIKSYNTQRIFKQVNINKTEK